MSSLLKIVETQASGTHVTGPLAKIISHLEKETGERIVKIPGVENYKNSIDAGYGIRFAFSGKTKCVRFNWGAMGSVGHATLISSVDVWDGTSSDPTRHITTKNGESFLKVLPQLAAALDTKINEGIKGEFTPETALNDFILRLRKGKTFTRGDFASAYHSSNIDVFDTLVSKFSNQITLSNKRVSAKRGTDYEALKVDLLAATIESLNIDDGGDGETFDDFKDDDTVSFIDTLGHMEDLVTGIANGAFNGLFVAGKGGTGKTQTVEHTLAKLGLKDGTGYFKNTGSATAAGIYALLYKYQDDIILFDDSDGALADVDSRNLIKAATDTKKVRKIAWTKSGKISDEVGKTIPPAFFFHGRIIFISNMSLEKLDPDGAIRTRAFVIVINPTNDELIDHMKNILPHIATEGTISLPEREKVLDVVREIGKKKDISLRTLVRALNICASGVPNWALLCRLYA